MMMHLPPVLPTGIYWPTVPAAPVRLRRRDGSVAEFQPRPYTAHTFTASAVADDGRLVSAAERARRRESWAEAWDYMDQEERRQAFRFAAHEAGHAVVAHYLGGEILSVRVQWKVAAGRVLVTTGYTHWTAEGDSRGAEAHLAGGVAERMACPRWVAAEPWSDSDRAGASEALRTCGRTWQEAAASAETILRSRWGSVLALMGMLLHCGHVGGLDAERAIRSAPGGRN